MAELLDSLAHLVDARQVGRMLDALMVCMPPMCAAAAWAAGHSSRDGVAGGRQGSRVEPSQQQPSAAGKQPLVVVHVPGYGPYQHRMLLRSGEGKGGLQSLATLSYLCVQLVATKEGGHTWLSVWVEGPKASSPPSLLQTLQARLQGSPGCYVHAKVEQGSKQVWVLVDNNTGMQQALELCAQAAGQV